jgi:P27 family predicted phage terminase small subunit
LQGPGRIEYYRAGRILLKVRVMTEADYTALLAYAELFGRWMEAEEQVRKHGLIGKSPNGHPVQNPYLAISNRARKECMRLAVEFGMTPSSRSRIQVLDDKKVDQFDAFLEGAYSATHEG